MPPDHRPLSTDAKDLEGAFIGTYEFTRQQLATIDRVRSAAGITGPRLSPQTELRIKCHRWFRQAMKFFDSGRLEKGDKKTVFYSADLLLTPLFSRYLDPWCSKHESTDDSFTWRSEVMMKHILFATVLATLSLFVRSESHGHIGVAVDMPFIYSRENVSLGTWFTATIMFLSSIQNRGLSTAFRKWGHLILEVCSILSCFNSFISAFEPSIQWQ